MKCLFIFSGLAVFMAALALPADSAAPYGSVPSWINSVSHNGPFVRSTSGDINGDGFDDLIIAWPNIDFHGKLRMYLGGPAGLGATHSWEYLGTGGATGAKTGWDLDARGDFNKDGYDDLVFSVRNYSNGESSEGKVIVFAGSNSGLAAVGSWEWESNIYEANAGHNVEWADLNGDGASDLVVGTSSDPAEIFMSDGNTLSISPDQTIPGYITNLANVGDINKDGRDDIAFAEDWYDNGESGEGHVLLRLGTPTGLGPPVSDIEGNLAGAKFAQSLAAAGDTNNDGYDDLLLGSLHWSNPEGSEGIVQVYPGNSTGNLTIPLWSHEGDLTYFYEGSQVMGLGDIDHDGYDDIIAFSNKTKSDGARIYRGSASGPLTTTAWTYALAESGLISDNGWIPGDFNGDGYSDLVLCSDISSNDYRINVFLNQYGVLGTPTISPTFSVSPTFSHSPTLSPTASVTQTSTVTPTPTATGTSTTSPTITPTATSTMTPTPSLTSTYTLTSTVTPTMTPCNPVALPFHEDFDGPGLPCSFSWIDPSSDSGYTFSGGNFNMAVGNDENYSGSFVDAPWLLVGVSGDFVAETRITALAQSGNMNMAWLRVYGGPSGATESPGVGVLWHDVSGTWRVAGPSATTVSPPNIWLRLVRIGNSFSGYYSNDGVVWNLDASVDTSLGATVEVGLLGLSCATSCWTNISFDYFDMVTPDPTPTPSVTITATNTLTATPVDTPTLTVSPSVTTTPTPGFAKSSLVKSVLGPVPVRRGRNLCLYVEATVARSRWQVFNLAGEFVANVEFGTEYSQCWPSRVAPGVYFVRVELERTDGSKKNFVQKVVVGP